MYQFSKMGCTSPLSVIILLYFCQIQGSSAVTPVFVQTGKDLHLNVMKAVTLKDGAVLTWKFNGKTTVIRYFTDRGPIVPQSYSGRVDVTGENFSLKMKNLTKADSGVYNAEFSGDETETVAEYRVTVQDPVSPVKLRVDSASGSSDSCNVTVTCSTQDSHISITFTCDNQTCSQKGGQSEVTTSGASLHVHVTNDFIFCNQSNQVSQTEDRKKVEHFCIQQEGFQQSTGSITVSVVVPVLGLSVLILFAVAYCLRKRRNSKTERIENTVYEVPQTTAMMRTLDQTPTADNSVNSPNSTYCTVGPHTGGTTIPESLYAQVERPKS